jgi:tRNA threonylcarbamoyladenosine biosynthesis protein TsaB
MNLVFDTATRSPVVALARPDGSVLAERRWLSRHRHGEELLQRVDEVLAEIGGDRSALTGVVVGTGPGSFTGLRIGLAAAKTIAYAMNVPIVGVSSTLALALAAASDADNDELVVTLPAGAADRYVHRVRIDAGLPRELEAPQLVADHDVGEGQVAVDFDPGKAPAGAAQRGAAALAGLGSALSRLGARRLADGLIDDAAHLVPAYIALPRGIARAVAEMTWSPDLR